jgi:hypothetical protein
MKRESAIGRVPRLERESGRCAALSLGAALSLFSLCGCGKTLTEEDCRKIADSMREAFQVESQKAATAEGQRGDKGAAAIKAEEDKLVADWSAECKKELEGRRVDASEVDCLRTARSIEQINKCGAR